MKQRVDLALQKYNVDDTVKAAIAGKLMADEGLLEQVELIGKQKGTVSQADMDQLFLAHAQNTEANRPVNQRLDKKNLKEDK
jgi:hypothetical protein